jgi:hypothetical protein
MDKILILKICVFVNILFLAIFVSSFFILNNSESTYFNIGWSKNFVFVSYTIDTPFKYYTLCFYIILLNSMEVYLNDISYPIITFSTYNPYKKKINDFHRIELEMYSNIIFFTQTLKKMLQVMITLSQIDIACISLVSSQISAYFAIKYLLDNKSFENKKLYVEVDAESEELTECTKYSYQSIHDLSMNI